MHAAEARERFALDALEFTAIRERLARHTSFSAGRELALALSPTADLREARRWQAETREALRLAALQPSLHLGGVHDVRAVAHRARVGGLLAAEELLDVASTVRAARSWRRHLRQLADELPALAEIASIQVSDHPALAEAIHAAIGEDASVLDAASPTLSRVRRELRGAHDRLVSRLRELMAVPPIRDAVQDPVVTQRAGRYVIPVRADARGQVPGIIHDQSASGATLFVEPLAVVELGNRWRTFQVEEAREVERVLRALTARVGEQAAALASTVEGLARLDLALAKARLANELRAAEPELVPLPRRAGDPVLRLVEARHPLLLGEVVPISLELGAGFDILVITGPNTGGKTVALKTAGLLTLMAQAGLFVPAREGSLLAIFERVQADIGDEQSLQQSLSTFSSHVTHIIRMLPTADSCSLLLLDELGAGTDPQEGAALARALLGYLQDRGAYVVATTHYPELKAYAHVTPRVANASVEFDLDTLSPTYRLLVGVPGRSNALAIAQRLGMPAEVLAAAQAHLSPPAAEVEAFLGEIATERAAAQAARERAERDASEAARLHAEARASLREARRRGQAAWEEARAEADQALRQLRREALHLQQQLRRAGAGSREVIAAALELQPLAQLPHDTSEETEPPAEAPQPATLEPGAQVFVPRFGLPGRVLALRDGEVELEILGRRVRLPAADLEGTTRVSGADREVPAGKAVLSDSRRGTHSGAQRLTPDTRYPAPDIQVALARPPGDVPLQLDLRGLRRDEALERLDHYLEHATLAGLPSARIVHGKGTGAIRQAVRLALRSSPLVARFAPEPDAAGGDGATTVWLSG